MSEKIDNIISEEKLDRYIFLTSSAMEKLKITLPKKTHLQKAAKDYLDMANRYYNDALHFKKIGKYVECFAALNYSHGWLDAGARMGLFDVEYDDFLFTVDDNN